MLKVIKFDPDEQIHDLRALQRHVDRMDCRPGTRLVVDNSGFGTSFVNVRMKIKNKKNGYDDTLNCSIRVVFPILLKDLVHEIYATMVKLETHEVQEYFSYAGVNIYNPHPEIGKTEIHVREAVRKYEGKKMSYMNADVYSPPNYMEEIWA